MSKIVIRQAAKTDAKAIQSLLKDSQRSHQHVDWRTPTDWLGRAGFWLAERPAGLLWTMDEVVACLAVEADPLPAGWVRLAAIKNNRYPFEIMAEMFQQAIPYLRSIGATHLGWLVSFNWPEDWVVSLGFTFLTHVQGWFKTGLDVPAGNGNSMVCLRPGQLTDLPALVAIEEAAFEPLWRHSLNGLELGWRQSLCFDVAELDGQIVGFQYSTASRLGEAHLVRLTVHPTAQGKGVGATLLKGALSHFAERNVREVTLNTQSDNHASHRLYQRFGFNPAGYELPVMVYNLATNYP